MITLVGGSSRTTIGTLVQTEKSQIKPQAGERIYTLSSTAQEVIMHLQIEYPDPGTDGEKF